MTVDTQLSRQGWGGAQTLLSYVRRRLDVRTVWTAGMFGKFNSVTFCPKRVQNNAVFYSEGPYWSTTRTLALATRLTRQTIRVNVVFQPNPVPGFTTLHPTLRDHWTNFDGDLTETLQDPLTIERRGPLSLWKRNLLSTF